MRAINAVRIANFLTATRKISFDTVVRTMYETGRDLSGRYRETAEGGLAKNYRRPWKKVRPARKILQISVAPRGQTVL